MMRFLLAFLLLVNSIHAQTIVDVVVESEDHTTLEAAVIAAGLAETLAGEGPFTIFAPTDAAFEALPEGTLDALLADPTGDLTTILQYHVVGGAKVLSSDLMDGQTAVTLQGAEIRVTKNDDGVFINDTIKVTAADIEADNGVVHVIDAVLLPPPPEEELPASVVEIIVNSEDHDTLEMAVIAAALAETLGGEGPFTVFAPTDAAFAALPEGTLDALLADPTGDLTTILQYHVVAGKVLSSDLMDGQTAATLEGSEIRVTKNDDGVFINDTVKVTVADIEADNGVVHVIDAVLLPPPPEELPASVVEVIANSEDHTTLEAAVMAAGLAETLAGEGPFTVFAPTDAAFEALPEGALDALLADPTGGLTTILQYHVVAGKILSSDLMDGQMAATLEGTEIRVTKNDDGVFINGIKVTTADIETQNGVVHVIDAVLDPTMLSVTQLDKLSLIKVFPNPVAEKLNIETENNYDIIEAFDIYDLSGNLMAGYKNLKGAQKVIDVTSLAKGSYNILLTVNSKTYSKTLIKQ